MKKSVLGLLFLILLGFAFQACDKIEPTYKEVGGGQATDDTRKVLLEDYTGHTCVNCPAAAKVGHQLVELFSGKVIMIGIHAGYFADPKPAPFNNDYRTEAGNAWDVFFGMSAAGNPIGMVNRKSSQGVYAITNGNWGTEINAVIEAKASITLDIATEYNSSSRSLKATLTSKVLQDITTALKLQVLIVEDSIVSAQRNNDASIGSPTILDYVHRHVLRGSMNGSWGDDLAAAGQALAGATFEKSYTQTLNSSLNEKHVTVVAFVYDATTYEVIQVEEKHIQ